MSRPLPDPVLFLDECLGSTDVPEALRQQSCQVEVFLEHFKSGTPDQDWLPIVGGKSWVVLTKDKMIRKRKAEMEALVRGGVAAFVLTTGDLTGAEIAAAFSKAIPRIKKVLRDYLPPFVAAVRGDGSVELLTSPQRRADVRKGATPEGEHEGEAEE